MPSALRRLFTQAAITLSFLSPLAFLTPPANAITLMTEDVAVFQAKSHGQEIAETGYTLSAFMGASTMRFHLGMDPATGYASYYAKLDPWLADVERRGFTPYLTLTYQPGTWTMPPPGPAESGFAAGFETFCGNVAQRYNGRIMRFGVWNEPNNNVGGRGSNPEYNGQPRGLDTYPQFYSELYRRCYSAIKQVNSSMKVYYGEIDAHKANPCTYVYNSLTTPMHTDGIAIHTYQWKLDPEQPLQGLVPGSDPPRYYTSCQGIGRLPDWNAGRQYWHNTGKLRTPQNGVAAIHITEHGYCAEVGECPRGTGNQNSINSESQRADFTRRAYSWAAAQGVQTFSYYHLFNQPSGPDLWDSGIVSLGGVPSESVFSLRQVTGSTRTTDTVGMFQTSSAGIFLLRNENSAGPLSQAYQFGVGTDDPVSGDWNGDGIDTAAVFRPSTGWWYQRNSHSSGVHDNAFQFGGVPGDIAVAGDWNGDGFDSIGVFRSSSNYWFLRNSNSTGPQDYLAEFGAPGDIPVAGDWNGDGSDSIGVFRPSTGWWYLRNTNDGGPHHNAFQFGGAPGDMPVVGDWNGIGKDTVGIFRPSNHTWHLRYGNSFGAPNAVFDFGSGSDTPLAGNWDGF